MTETVSLFFCSSQHFECLKSRLVNICKSNSFKKNTYSLTQSVYFVIIEQLDLHRFANSISILLSSVSELIVKTALLNWIFSWEATYEVGKRCGHFHEILCRRCLCSHQSICKGSMHAPHYAQIDYKLGGRTDKVTVHLGLH